MFETNIENLRNFYCYVFEKKRLELIIFLIVNYVFSLLPIVIVSLFVFKLDDATQKGFFGDGSIISLCMGILCTYFSLLFDFKSETEKNKNIIINLVLVIIYVLSFLFFKECQLHFSRSWPFIYTVTFISFIYLIFTFFCSLYLNFRYNVDAADLEKYVEEKKRKKIENAASSKTTSKTGVRV